MLRRPRRRAGSPAPTRASTSSRSTSRSAIATASVSELACSREPADASNRRLASSTLATTRSTCASSTREPAPVLPARRSRTAFVRSSPRPTTTSSRGVGGRGGGSEGCTCRGCHTPSMQSPPAASGTYACAGRGPSKLALSSPGSDSKRDAGSTMAAIWLRGRMRNRGSRDAARPPWATFPLPAACVAPASGSCAVRRGPEP